MDYDILLKPIYDPLEVVKINEAKTQSDHHWFNRTLSEVNNSLVRIGVFEGEFHWHSHENEDEFFLVLEGELVIELKNREPIRLGVHEGVLVPKGVEHRPISPNKSVVLMIEQNTIVPTGT